ncbi:MAG: sigma-54-dependent Fis family transcriptional regulator [bacterium]|nr:sigma-54-dependent Fis family transcriptional regulator [bacterium]
MPAFTAVLLSADLLLNSNPGVRESLSTVQTAAGTDQTLVLFDTALPLDLSSRAISAGVTGFVSLESGQVDEPALRRHLATAAQRRAEQRRRDTARHEARALDQHGFIVRSPTMARVLDRAVKASQVSDVPVIIYGESGTGKQLLAETIHRLDPKRAPRRFLSVNCASISGTLADSELFGHVKGAFTGATENRQGHFRAADGGTLLLDEIGELDAALQPKLLRALQEGVVLPVGADEETPVDVRVIAATHRLLPAMVEQGTFRLDLYQRLNVVVLEIPPLCERPEDIASLIQFFLRKYASYYRAPIREVDPRVYDAFAHRPLTGNVRELENAVRQMLAFKTNGDSLDLADLETIGYGTSDPSRASETITRELLEVGRRLLDDEQLSLPVVMEQLERQLLAEAVKRSTGTSVNLAKSLGLSRRTFYNKLRKYRI